MYMLLLQHLTEMTDFISLDSFQKEFEVAYQIIYADNRVKTIEAIRVKES